MGPVDVEKTWPWIEAKVTALPELPWVNQLFLHFLIKGQVHGSAHAH